MIEISVIEPGQFTTVQDALGRPGWRRYGIQAGGAVDPWSARIANRLVGNSENAPVLEATVSGPSLRFSAPAAVAFVGGEMEVAVQERRLSLGVTGLVRAADTLRLGARTRGARTYLAIAGDWLIPRVLNSVATDVRSGYGGIDGRPLSARDSFRVRRSQGDFIMRRFFNSRYLRSTDRPIRIVASPHVGLLPKDALELLCGHPWTVSTQADRMGCRLDGPDIGGGLHVEVPSLGLPNGAVQVPPDGRPIVLLADRGVTGGYPVVASVIAADIGKAAQLFPGDPVSFELVRLDEARSALVEMEDVVARVAEEECWPLAAWAGALE